MDPQRTDILRGAFNMTTTTAASAPPKAKAGTSDVYDRQYKKFIARGMSPKQAAALARSIADRVKSY